MHSGISDLLSTREENAGAVRSLHIELSYTSEFQEFFSPPNCAAPLLLSYEQFADPRPEVLQKFRYMRSR